MKEDSENFLVRLSNVTGDASLGKNFQTVVTIRDNEPPGIVAWGSTKGPVEELVKRAEARGQKVSAFVPQLIFPFPKQEFEEFLSNIGQLLVVEQNYTAQFYKYMRSFVDLPADRTHVYKMSGGRMLTAAEIEVEVAKLLEPAASLAGVLA